MPEPKIRDVMDEPRRPCLTCGHSIWLHGDDPPACTMPECSCQEYAEPSPHSQNAADVAKRKGIKVEPSSDEIDRFSGSVSPNAAGVAFEPEAGTIPPVTDPHEEPRPR